MLNEREWVKTIRNLLNDHFKISNPVLHAEIEIALPYRTVVVDFDKNWNSRYSKENRFCVDLLVYEQTTNAYIPRVVLEAKIVDGRTDSLISYNNKLKQHKALIPYLRYGLMIGSSKSTFTQKYSIHGSDFDFMCRFKAEIPSEKECDAFFTLVDSEIEDSRRSQKLHLDPPKEEEVFCIRKGIEILKIGDKK